MSAQQNIMVSEYLPLFRQGFCGKFRCNTRSAWISKQSKLQLEGERLYGKHF